MTRLLILFGMAVIASGCSSEALAQAAPQSRMQQRVNVAWIGDSITLGVTGTDAFRPPQRLGVLLGADNYLVRNFGVSGYTVSNIRDVWTTRARRMGYQVLIIEGGVNDLRVGTAAATIFATVEDTMDEAKADGMRVVPLTVLPWSTYVDSTAARQTETLALNASIRAWCTANASTCVDAYAGMGQGGAPTELADAYDSGDGLHPSETAGNAALAALVKLAFP